MPIKDGVKEYILRLQEIILPMINEAVRSSHDKSLRELFDKEASHLSNALNDNSNQYNNKMIESVIARLVNFCLDPKIRFRSPEPRKLSLRSLLAFRYQDCSGLINHIDEGMLLNSYMLDNPDMHMINARGDVHALAGDTRSEEPVLWCRDENKIGGIRLCNILSSDEEPLDPEELPSIPLASLETIESKLKMIKDVYHLRESVDELCGITDIRLEKVSTGRKLLCIVNHDDPYDDFMKRCYSLDDIIYNKIIKLDTHKTEFDKSRTFSGSRTQSKTNTDKKLTFVNNSLEEIKEIKQSLTRFDAILSTASVSVMHGFISGVATLMEEQLSHRGLSKELSLVVSKLFYYLNYFMLELRRQQLNDSTSSYQASSIPTAFYNTVSIIVVNLLIVAIGMLIHLIGNSLKENGWVNTAKFVNAAEKLLPCSLFAVNVAKGRADTVVASLVTGGLAREATTMVGRMIIR